MQNLSLNESSAALRVRRESPTSTPVHDITLQLKAQLVSFEPCLRCLSTIHRLIVISCPRLLGSISRPSRSESSELEARPGAHPPMGAQTFPVNELSHKTHSYSISIVPWPDRAERPYSVVAGISKHSPGAPSDTYLLCLDTGSATRLRRFRNEERALRDSIPQARGNDIPSMENVHCDAMDALGLFVTSRPRNGEQSSTSHAKCGCGNGWLPLCDRGSLGGEGHLLSFSFHGMRFDCFRA
ncbi:unnamed protein product [Mycena citricolor]|uniref:Uncharacterized protein n=1 Tax=Mycena citricolor TaxID=2018698 RepID=A0AAD2GZE8_9AGAR|nr:unnamed protein product [Mycena citricolor]